MWEESFRITTKEEITLFRGKKYKDSAKLVDRSTQYEVPAAMDLVVKTASAKFDETVEVHIKLGVDSRHADQQVRGAIVLPNGTGKTRKVLVFAKDAKLDEAKEAGAVIVPVDRRKLDAMSFTRSHQGVIALAAAHEYYSIDDILEEAASRGEAPLIVICDELSDPHNLGAILRSAECAGAHGVIIPKRRSVGLTATVAKASAGAMEYMKVARVSNINAAMQELKDKGVWIFGTAAEGAIPMYKADLKGPAAIVIGNEGVGMSQLVRKNCDVIVSIPMAGRISSLNASAAASILLYEAVRQRLG